MPEQCAQSGNHIALEEYDDALIATLVRDVRESPADIVENFWSVSFCENLGKGWDGALDLLELGGRFALAQVR